MSSIENLARGFQRMAKTAVLKMSEAVIGGDALVNPGYAERTGVTVEHSDKWLIHSSQKK